MTTNNFLCMSPRTGILSMVITDLFAFLAEAMEANVAPVYTLTGNPTSRPHGVSGNRSLIFTIPRMHIPLDIITIIL